MKKPAVPDRSRFFELASDMLCVLDRDGKFLDANVAWHETVGWTPSELIGSSVYDRTLDQDHETIRISLAESKNSRSASGFASNFLHKNTATRYFFWSCRFDAENGVFLMSARDRTDMRRISEETETAKKQLEKAFGVLSVGMMVFGSHGEIVQYNQAALRILGLTKEQLEGKSSFDPRWHAIDEDGAIINGEDLPAPTAQRTGLSQRRTIGIHQANGDLRWVVTTADPIFQADLTIPHQVLITFNDITEERAAAAKLRYQEEELARVIDHMPALIGYWDRNLNIVFSNRSYGQIRGMKPEELRGRNMRDFVPKETLAVAEEHVIKALDGIGSTFEIEMTFAPGDVRPTLISYVPDRKNGVVVGFLSVATDLSQLRKLEKERREFESKFIAASKMSAMGEMAAGIAHEINNPLAIINGKTALLQLRIEKELYEPKKFNAELEAINKTVERIAKTVRGLLSFSRHTEHEKAQTVSVNSVINSTFDLCREKMRNRGIELRLNVDPSIVVDCRPHQISQILMNLINNANDAIANLTDPWISVTVESYADFIRIRVTDSGRRIEPAIAEKLMNPFFTTKEIGKGTGLGLSISKGLAESHGGTLTYDRRSENTSFVLELPRKSSGRESLPKAG